MTTTKVFETHTKAADPAQGIVKSLVSVFGNVDAQGDRVLPGAFRKSIGEWKVKAAKGNPLPVVYAHKDDPAFLIGKVLDMRETHAGLEVVAKYFLDKPKARDAFDGIRQGLIPGSSFSYDVIKAQPNSYGGFDLEELRLREVGPTMYPANAETAVVRAKGSTESSRAFAARMRRALGNGTKPEPERVAQVITSDYIPTPEEVAAHQAETERRENEKIRINAEVRKEEGQRALEEHLIAGHPTQRMQDAEVALRYLNACAKGRWVPNARLDGAMPVWSPWVSTVEADLERRVREGVANALAPRIEAARVELKAAEAERDEIVRALRGRAGSRR